MYLRREKGARGETLFFRLRRYEFKVMQTYTHTTNINEFKSHLNAYAGWKKIIIDFANQPQ